jgi:two-component sensor histidine kinase
VPRLPVFILLFPFLLAGQKIPCPIAAFMFNNGEINDANGKLNARIVGANFTTDRFGNDHSAIYFQGNLKSYVNLGSDTLLKQPRGTISFWVHMDNIVLKGSGIAVNPFIITKCQPGNSFYEAYFAGYDFTNQRLSATTALDQSSQISLYSTRQFSIRQWHHIAISWDDNYFSLYVDGRSDIKQIKNFRSRYLPGDSVVLGSCANTVNQRCMNGSIDDVMFFDRVLDEKEIASLYNAPDPNKNRVIIRWILLGIALLAAMLCTVWLINLRYKRALEKEKEKNRMKARMYELETRAFKTQMNPHFIFNSLNTVQKLILQTKTDEAHEYVAKFSKLLRKLLEGGSQDTLPLGDEIDILNSYLEIERFRFDNSFEYTITSHISAQNIFIPFMLVQPLIENAVWHGLLPKKGDRKLQVTFSDFDEKRILCAVDDNGVGREASSHRNNFLKKKPAAIEFITQRLDVIGKTTSIQCGLNFTDKKNEAGESLGTKVEIIIPKLGNAASYYH